MLLSGSRVGRQIAKFSRARRDRKCSEKQIINNRFSRRGVFCCASSASNAYSFKHLDGTSMDSTLNSLRDVSIEPFKGSKYVVPQTVTFNLEGSARSWDMIRSMCSVAVVLYHKQLNSAILVRQFRPPVWAAQVPEDAHDAVPLQQGFTYELCAGLIDKADLSPKEIAKEEIAEECGFDVNIDSIHEITRYVHATAHLGTTETVFYAEVDEKMRSSTSTGGGLIEDGESIQVLALPLEECQQFIADPNFPKSAATIIGLQWLLDKKAKTN